MDASPTLPICTNALPASSTATTASSATAAATLIATPQNVGLGAFRDDEAAPPIRSNICPAYHPHGKWAWADGLEILNKELDDRFCHKLEGSSGIKVAYIGDRELVYLYKSYSFSNSSSRFLSDFYLNANYSYLRPLQGVCVPWVIGVCRRQDGQVDVVQDLPHATGWREADAFIGPSYKEAVIAAYQKIHAQGILHCAAEYRNWLIGDDGKVTIINFEFSRVLFPDDDAQKANVASCSRDEIRDEMRKVRFLLDYKKSRKMEYEFARASHNGEESRKGITINHIEGNQATGDTFILEPMFPALRLSDLDLWSTASDLWTAKQYNIIRPAGYHALACKQVALPSPPGQPVAAIRPIITILSSTPASASTRNTVGATGCLKRSRVQDSDDEDADLEGVAKMLTEPDLDEEIILDGPKSGRPAETPVRKRQRISEKNLLNVDATAPSTTEVAASSAEKIIAPPEEKTTIMPAEPARPSGEAVAPQAQQRPEMVKPLIRSYASLNLAGPSQTPTITASAPHPSTTFKSAVRPPLPASSGTVASTPRPSRRLLFESLEDDREKLSSLFVKASDTWKHFCDARERLELLQSKLDAQKSEAERFRDSLLFTLFSVSGNDRQTLLDAIAQPDSLSMLELQVNRPAPDSAAILRDRRAKLAGGVVHSHLTRPQGRPSMRKVNPRVTDIKRGQRTGYGVKVPSKLGTPARAPRMQIVPRTTPEPASVPSQSSDVSEPSPKIKASLEKVEEWRTAMIRRMGIEQGKADTSSSSQRHEEPQIRSKLEQQGRESSDASSPHPPLLAVQQKVAAGSSSATPSSAGENVSLSSHSLPGGKEEQLNRAGLRHPLSTKEMECSNTKTSKIPTAPDLTVSKQDRFAPAKVEQSPDKSVIVKEPGADAGASALPIGKRKRDEQDEVIGPEDRERKMPRLGSVTC